MEELSESGGKINWKISMLWFWTAYFVVTLVGVAHTCFNWLVLKIGADTMPVSNTYEVSEYAVLPYVKTIPFHPLYNIVLWPLFAYLYYKMAKPQGKYWKAALNLGLSWVIITILFDMAAWVLIHHPWAMTWKEMYVDYQPWITLIYLSIFFSAFIGMFFYKKQNDIK